MGKITFGLPAMDKGYFSQNKIEKIYYNNIKVYTSTIKLETPIVSISGDILTITPGDAYTTTFVIIENGAEIAAVDRGTQPSVMYDLSGIGLSIGQHFLTVIARAAECYDSDPSDEVSYIMYGKCSTPIAVMLSNGYELAFTAVNHAVYYSVLATQGSSTWEATGITVPPTRYDLRNINLAPGSGLYSVQIKAVGEQYYHDSDYSVASEYYLLAAPTNLSVSGVTATFSRADYADSYDLYVDGNLLGNYTPASLSAATVTVDLESFAGWWNLSAGAHTLTVKSKRTNSLDSDASSAASFSKMPKLDTPQNVAVSDTIATFDEVEHAEQYQVYIDGTSIGTVHAPIAPPVRNDVTTSGVGTYVAAKSSFIDEAEEYEYFIDGVSVGRASLSFLVGAFPVGLGGSGSSCTVYGKINSDTVSATDYTWKVDSNGNWYSQYSPNEQIPNVTKVALMSSINEGKVMAVSMIGGANIMQSTTPVVVKIYGDGTIGLVYHFTG